MTWSSSPPAITASSPLPSTSRNEIAAAGAHPLQITGVVFGPSSSDFYPSEVSAQVRKDVDDLMVEVKIPASQLLLFLETSDTGDDGVVVPEGYITTDIVYQVSQEIKFININSERGSKPVQKYTTDCWGYKLARQCLLHSRSMEKLAILIIKLKRDFPGIVLNGKFHSFEMSFADYLSALLLTIRDCPELILLGEKIGNYRWLVSNLATPKRFKRSKK